MNWLLDSESMFNRFLFRVFDTLLLAVLTIICSLPIITVGAAMSALYDMMIKIVMDKDNNLFKSYFKSFGKNFVKGTLIWLICLVGAAFVGINLYFMYLTADMNQTIRLALLGIIIIVTIVFLFIYIYAFPLQARYENKVFTTVKNAFFISIAQLPKSLGLLFLHIVVWVPALITLEIVPILIILELSLVAYVTARNMVKIFAIFGDDEAKGETKVAEKESRTEENQEADEEKDEILQEKKHEDEVEESDKEDSE